MPNMAMINVLDGEQVSPRFDYPWKNNLDMPYHWGSNGPL
jgi:hypothetical protein